MDYLVTEALHDLATTGRLSNETAEQVRDLYASNDHRKAQLQHELDTDDGSDPKRTEALHEAVTEFQADPVETVPDPNSESDSKTESDTKTKSQTTKTTSNKGA